MKLLYIGSGAVQNAKVTGGTRGNARSLDMCRLVCGEHNVMAISPYDETPGKIRQAFTIIFRKSFVTTRKKKKEIFDLIDEKGIDTVYLDMSLLGSLARDIKKYYPGIGIISFFHNVEYDYRLEYIKTIAFHNKLLMHISAWDARRSERLTCLYSNVIIALNSRDANQIYKYYHRKPDVLIPVCLKDGFNPMILHPLEHQKPLGLMVGNNFRPNVNGLNWFIKQVLPNVNMKLVVVGNNMDFLASKYSDVPNLEIHGFVDDLSKYYAEADFMICPIFEGSGMKVKTAEALEYGKFVFAGPEAAVGYEFTEKEIVVCENAQQFIESINNFKRPAGWTGFVSSSRELYLRNYSYDRSVELFRYAFGML